jgi:hypothetical protein
MIGGVDERAEIATAEDAASDELIVAFGRLLLY